VAALGRGKGTSAESVGGDVTAAKGKKMGRGGNIG